MKRALPIAMLTLTIGAADLAAQIPMPSYARTYASTRVRGYYFQAPTPFVITHCQVPDETSQGNQYVGIYKLTAAPPPYSQTIPATPAFYSSGVKSDKIIAVMPPVVVKKDEWIAVLGSCGMTGAGNQANSYGTAAFAGRILGMPIVMNRCGMQQTLDPTKGVGPMWSENAGPISRTLLWVAGQGSTAHYGTGSGAPAPSLMRLDPNPPSIGFTAGLTAKAGTATNKGGAWVIGLQRASVKIPGIGTILTMPIAVTIPVTAIPALGTSLTLKVPNNKQFINAKIPMQLAVLEGYGLGLSNGAEWTIGQ
ncbi:MAG: hypothetical protein QF412_00755 [Planctomycetota bacterium]|nr:hypothetical protein [Planctomycetota bacterium]